MLAAVAALSLACGLADVQAAKSKRRRLEVEEGRKPKKVKLRELAASVATLQGLITLQEVTSQGVSTQVASAATTQEPSTLQEVASQGVSAQPASVVATFQEPITLQEVASQGASTQAASSSSSSSSFLPSASVMSASNFDLGKVRFSKADRLIDHSENEDHYVVMPPDYPDQKHLSNKHLYLAVFDGHSGPGVAKLLCVQLHKIITQKNIFDSDVKKAIRKGFNYTDRMIKKSYMRLGSTAVAGSAAVVCFIVGGTKLTVAHVGDSRVVVADCGGRVVRETKDHHPHDPAELERIMAAGGLVQFSPNCTRARINDRYAGIDGRSAASRSFGDFCFYGRTFEKLRGYIVEPTIISRDLEASDYFMIIASAGLWGVISSKDAAEIVHNVFKNPKATAQDAVNVLYDCVLRCEDSDYVLSWEAGRYVWKKKVYGRLSDDLTILVVRFPWTFGTSQ